MIASMTGYAALTFDLPQGALQLEIKSVNSRFLDIQFRIGEELRSLEPALRELIAARVVRGKVDCRFGFTPRTQSGAGLALDRDLLARVATLAREARALVPLMPQIVAAYQEKLSARLREVLASGEEERIRQEVAVFGVKIDVAEELSRLSAHLDEVSRVIASGGKGAGSAGKRLDFLMQELNREANTLGSKSVARELSEAAIELKLLIEQMREQIQNVE